MDFGTKKSVELIYNKDKNTEFKLLVCGIYYPPTISTQDEAGCDGEFEVTLIELLKGDLYDAIAENLSIEKITDKVFEILGN